MGETIPVILDTDIGTDIDDAWALAAVFYQMLTGQAPPPAGVADAADLERLGLEDPALAKVVMHGLTAAAGDRAADVTAFKREVARWLKNPNRKSPSRLPNVIEAIVSPASSNGPQRTVPSAVSTAPQTSVMRRDSRRTWLSSAALPRRR